MVAYTYLLLLAAAFVQPNRASALPDAPANIQTDWVDSAFVTCLKKTYPNYPKGVTNPNVVLACRSSHKKRGGIDTDSFDLESRGLPGLAPVPGADCDGGEKGPLPKNFITDTDLSSQATAYCTQMKGDIIQSGLGQINKTFPNAVTKIGNELHGGKKVVLSILLAVTPQGRAVMKGGAVADAALMTGCTQTISELSKLCSAQLKWFNAGKAKTETTTGARGGGLDMTYGATDFAYASVEFTKP